MKFSSSLTVLLVHLIVFTDRLTLANGIVIDTNRRRCDETAVNQHFNECYKRWIDPELDSNQLDNEFYLDENLLCRSVNFILRSFFRLNSVDEQNVFYLFLRTTRGRTELSTKVQITVVVWFRSSIATNFAEKKLILIRFSTSKSTGNWYSVLVQFIKVRQTKRGKSDDVFYSPTTLCCLDEETCQPSNLRHETLAQCHYSFDDQYPTKCRFGREWLSKMEISVSLRFIFFTTHKREFLRSVECLENNEQMLIQDKIEQTSTCAKRRALFQYYDDLAARLQLSIHFCE